MPASRTGVLLLPLYRQPTAAQVGHVDAVIARACDMVRERVGVCAAGWSNPAPKQFDARRHSDLTVRYCRPADLASFVRRPAGPRAKEVPHRNGRK